MKCLSCDCILSDTEATLKYDHTDMFIDLCKDCLNEADIYAYLEEEDERNPDN